MERHYFRAIVLQDDASDYIGNNNLANVFFTSDFLSALRQNYALKSKTAFGYVYYPRQINSKR
jgi:hypothetical protein